MDTLSEKALAIHEILCRTYHCPIPYFHHYDPLSELISSLLSHRTRNKDSGAAFKTLRGRFSSWEAVKDAPTEEIMAAISSCTWPEQKAPRIKTILQVIEEKVGTLSLDFLQQLSPSEARQWLEQLPGVGPKTSAAVLVFSNLRMKALPVDSHHYRVAIRTGLVGPKASLEQAHKLLEAQLPADWSVQQVYDNHEVMMLHGQKCCYFTNPACTRCPILALCPYGESKLVQL
ncbi:MAG: hypothetical protein U0175_11455 [Caldilineaceae bacterium]